MFYSNLSSFKNYKFTISFLVGISMIDCMNANHTSKNMLTYSSNLQNDSDISECCQDEKKEIDIQNDSNSSKYDLYEEKEIVNNFHCCYCRKREIKDCYLYDFIKNDQSINTHKYLDDRFFGDIDFEWIYARNEIKKLNRNIFKERKRLLLKFLDCNKYLYQNPDIKWVIIEYSFSHNLRKLLRQNIFYRRFIYKKIFELEFNRRKKISHLMIKKYLNSNLIDYNNFIKHYDRLKRDSYSLRKRNFLCFLKIKPIKKLGWINEKLLKMEKYRSTKLTKQKYSIFCCKLKALNFWRILGSSLLVIFIGSVLILGLLSKNDSFILHPFSVLLGVTIPLIPIFLLMLDPGYKDICENYSKCKSKIYCIKSIKEQNEEILDISNKLKFIDKICCRKYDELYPGLLKPSYCSICLKKIKNLFKDLCENISESIKYCLDSCRFYNNCNLKSISIRCLCLCLKKIFNFEVIEEDLLSNIQNNSDHEEAVI